MTCGLTHCTLDRVHHHHVRDGVTLPAPCRCSRPTDILRPTIEQLLDFAATHPGRVTGHVDELLRTSLGITAVRYLQLLHEAIHTEEALTHDPLTTYRLRREAQHRARAREARTTGH